MPPSSWSFRTAIPERPDPPPGRRYTDRPEAVSERWKRARATESEQPLEQPTTPAEPETFDRPYVERLRTEAAEGRVKGKRADALAAALVSAYAAQSGRLADASDFAYSDDLLARKPHLASRRPVGDVGQGARPGEPEGVSLSGLLRAGAG